MQRIALIGGTGNVGRRILAEARRRGHAVTVVARHADPDLAGDGVAFVEGDVRSDVARLATSLRGHDALISATRFADVHAEQVLAVTRAAGIGRLLVVGGAASLRTASGQRLLDSPGFPQAYRAEATAGAAFLDHLRAVDDLDWTFLSPAAEFGPGARSGRFRIGGDDLLTDADGHSRISYEDFAIALLDELEHPVHPHTRFSVAY